MEVIEFILRAILFVFCYFIGYVVAKIEFKRNPRKFDGQIQVDGYELKGMVLNIDVPEIASKPYLIIEIKHEDQS